MHAYYTCNDCLLFYFNAFLFVGIPLVTCEFNSVYSILINFKIGMIKKDSTQDRFRWRDSDLNRLNLSQRHVVGVCIVIKYFGTMRELS